MLTDTSLPSDSARLLTPTLTTLRELDTSVRSNTKFPVSEIPPTVEQNARMCGTDVLGYVSEGPGLSAYALSDGIVYRTYVTTARGLEPAMAYYALLDRTPKGRDESDTRPLWVRRHDEYETG